MKLTTLGWRNALERAGIFELPVAIKRKGRLRFPLLNARCGPIYSLVSCYLRTQDFQSSLTIVHASFGLVSSYRRDRVVSSLFYVTNRRRARFLCCSKSKF
jgi:hypothetical protein